MMGGFITRVSVMILGYAYPAYECYKTVELNKPEIELLLFWCQYWILVAVLAVFERVGDALISWLPLYGEVKLAFFVYLWHPKTKGTTYIYNTFFRPYMSKHENKIDRTLLELKTRAADLAVRYWQKALSNGRSRFFEILQYIVSQPSSTMVHHVEEPRHAQHAAISSPPPQTDQTLTAQRQLQQLKTEQTNQVKIDNSQRSPASAFSTRSSTSHHPNPTPHNNEMLVQENLTTTNNSFPHSEDTTKQEEPMRIFRRSRIKKRVTTTTTGTSVH